MIEPTLPASGVASVAAGATKPQSQWWLPIAVLIAAVLIGHAPLGVLHLRSLWLQEQYQYFPFVLAAFAWLLYQRVRQAPAREVPLKGGAIPWALSLCSLAMLGLALVMVSPWLAFVSINIAFAAVMLWIARQREVTYIAGIWLLLWLLVPAPLGQDQRLVQYMQRLSSQMSSSLLDALGILHVTAGNVVSLPDRELFVDEACSGIVSAMSILACSVIYAVWRNRPPAHLFLLALLSTIWAVFMNVARISIVVMAHTWFAFDLASGTPHEILGLFLFLLAFGALVCTDYLLVGLLDSIPESEVGERISDHMLVRGWNRFVSWQPHPSDISTDQPGTDVARIGDDNSVQTTLGMKSACLLSIPFVLLGALQLIWMPSPDTAEARSVVERAMKLKEAVLPQRIGKWEFDSYEFVEREAYSDFGRYSHVFKYRHATEPAVRATISLDFPYLGGWHDLCACYRNSGWQLSERVVKTSDEHEPQWKFVEAMLASDTNGHATVLYAAFDVNGEAGEPSSSAVMFRPWFRVRRRLLHQIAPQLFQVQVFAPVAANVNEQLNHDLRELFTFGRTLLRKAVVADEFNTDTEAPHPDPLPKGEGKF